MNTAVPRPRKTTAASRALCPCCRQRHGASSDSIFPLAWGGQASVRTCAECKKRHVALQARVSARLSPLLAVFASNGIRTLAQPMAPPPNHHLRLGLHLGEDELRLALHVLVVLARAQERDLDAVDGSRVDWLRGVSQARPPSRWRFAVEPALSGLPGPAHYAGIEADPASGRVLGFVRICDLASVYLTLSEQYAGPAWSVLGRLDMVDRAETFTPGARLDLHWPPAHLPRVVHGLDQLMARQRLDRLMAARRGALRLRLSPPWLEARLLMGV